MKTIYVYDGYGTSEFCLNELTSCLNKTYQNSNIKVQSISSDQIRDGNLLKDSPSSNVLCIGGGFDLGYLSSFGQNGCYEIKKFVESGGQYLGICAGAYFACDSIEFDLNGPLEVIGDRPLKFFNGKAIGPINKLFKYQNESEAIAIKLNLNENETVTLDSEPYFYLNGGPYFEPNLNDKNSNYKILATYSNENNENNLIYCKNKIAVMELNVGKGKCLLSGVHFEIDPASLNLKNENIKNNVYPRLNHFNRNNIVKYLLDKLVDN